MEGVEAVSHPFNIKNVFRADEVREDKGFKEKFMRIAPDKLRDMVKVPGIL